MVLNLVYIYYCVPGLEGGCLRKEAAGCRNYNHLKFLLKSKIHNITALVNGELMQKVQNSQNMRLLSLKVEARIRCLLSVISWIGIIV